jgi:hypothetical protein
MDVGPEAGFREECYSDRLGAGASREMCRSTVEYAGAGDNG